MKKPLLFILLFISGLLNAQNVFNYGFATPTATMTSTDGWSRVNQSTLPSTTALWSVASYTSVTVSATVMQPHSKFRFTVLELFVQYQTGKTELLILLH